MNRPLSLLVLTGSVAGCASAAQPATNGTEPPVETRIDLAPAPSALEALGIKERVETEPSVQRDTERAIAAVSSDLAECFRASVDRDPKLFGSVTYAIDPRSLVDGGVSKTGDLETLPSAECARQVLAGLSIPSAKDAVVRYTVTFTGSYRPDPIAMRQGSLRASAWSVDWDRQDAAPPQGFERPVTTETEPLYRCLVGAEPMHTEPTWIVMNVGADGSVMVDEATSPDDEAEHCLRRQLGALRFPKHPRGVAVAALFQALPPGEEEEPSVPEEEDADGRGNMRGDEIGEAFGAGGLGLTGIGPGGSRHGMEIGVGTIGTIGHGAGTGTGQGFGKGRIGGSRTPPPKVKLGTASVGPKYPPEVIQRIVRQSSGQYRRCYEEALSKKPDLEGRVEVSFTIDRKGKVSSATGAGTMPDKSVISCVVAAFSRLEFPALDGGVIKVKYPLLFTSDGATAGARPAANAQAKPAAPSVPTIDGKPLHDVDAAALAARIRLRNYHTRLVPVAKGAAVPAVVFFRTGYETIGSVRIVKASGKAGASDCVRSDGGVALVIGGEAGSCAELMRELLD